MSAVEPFDVVGIGQCSLDILGRLSSFPEPDQKSELDELKYQGGGPVATALVTLARLGVSTTFCGRIGDDAAGRQIQAGLLEEHVDCQGLLVEVNASSQTSFVAVDDAGQRNIFCHRGTATPLLASEVNTKLIRQAQVLHLDGWQHEAALAAAKLARESGIATLLDGGSLRSRTIDLLPWIDHLVVSEKFAEQLVAGSSIELKLKALLAYGATAVTVTCGEHGCWTMARGGKSMHQTAFPVTVVDTTGCGDVFHGGYIYGLLQGWPLQRIVRFAAACAGLKCQQLGGRTAIPYLNEVMSYLKQ